MKHSEAGETQPLGCRDLLIALSSTSSSKPSSSMEDYVFSWGSFGNEGHEAADHPVKQCFLDSCQGPNSPFDSQQCPSM